jgi:hypothetical protein
VDLTSFSKLRQIGPFEVKDALVALAKKGVVVVRSTRVGSG